MRSRYLLMIVLMLPAMGAARTWRVELDGSGDYTNIQPAVDAASPRDTVLVGPGRYDTFWLFNPAYDWEVIVGISVDSLTIIGTDRDAVIIGPTSPYPQSRAVSDDRRVESKGIASSLGVTWMVIENMSFENTDVGIHAYPSGIIRNCTARYTHDSGFWFEKALRVLIENCDSYYGNGGTGIHLSAYGTGHEVAVVRNCRVELMQTGYYITHPNTIVSNCIAVSCNTGFALAGGRATMTNIQVDECFGGMVSDGGAVLNITDSVFRNCIYRDISAISGGYINGSNLLLSGGGAGETIHSANGLIDLHHSHIGHSAGKSVRVHYHIGPDDAMDLTGNYWGTTSADSIAAWIWDSHDDPTVHTTVRYEPFSPTQVPNENKSMSDVKAMFRR